MSKRPYFFLGSADAEMDAIEDLLQRCGVCYRRTRGPDGERLSPGHVSTNFPILRDDEYLVCVEIFGPLPEGAVDIDHHDDHPKASASPRDAVPASSLGQVIALLAKEKILTAMNTGWTESTAGWRGQEGDVVLLEERQGQRLGWCVVIGPTSRENSMRVLEIPPEVCALAAADHCLAAAFAGRVPGVDAETVMQVHIEAARKRFAPHLTLAQYMTEVQRAIGTLRAAPPALDLDPSGRVRDLCHLTPDGPVIEATGERYPLAFPHGPIAAALEGKGYVVPVQAKHGHVLRLNCCPPEAVRRWLDGVGEARGCYPADAPKPTKLYGSPERGSAGGTLKT